MSDEIKGLIDEQGKLIAGFQKAVEAKNAEIEKLGKSSSETEEKIAKLNARIDANTADMNRVAASLKRVSIVKDSKGNDLSSEALEHKRAFRSFMRGGAQAVKGDIEDIARKAMAADLIAKGYDADSREVKSLSVDSDPNGGFMVPADMSGQIVSKVYESSDIRAVAAQQTISTDSLDGTYDQDQVGSGWVSERGTRTVTATPVVGKWNIPVHELYAEPDATQKLIDDSSVDVEGWLAQKVADKFARDENTAFVNGSGVGKPRGFMTYTAVTGQPSNGQMQVVASGSSATFVATKLYATVYALKAAYRKGATWGMSRTSIGAVRQLVDSQGRFLWADSLQPGQPAMLCGFPVAEFNDLADPGSNSLSAVFGDFKRAYQIVDRMGIRVLRDPFTVKGKVLFYTTKRVGGDVINFEAYVAHKLG